MSTVQWAIDGCSRGGDCPGLGTAIRVAEWTAAIGTASSESVPKRKASENSSGDRL